MFFSCQPFSKAGDNQQGMDERAATLPYGLYAGYLLQKDFMITECVSEAASSAFVQRCLDYHLTMVPGDRSETLLELADVWPAKRRRWWQMISKGHYGKIQLAPLPKLQQSPTINGLIPDFLTVSGMELRELILTPYEREIFHTYGKGIEYQLVNSATTLNTALHSWENQGVDCACGCRPVFFIKRLQQSGLFGALIRVPTQPAKHDLRHIAPRDLAGWNSSQRLLPCDILLSLALS